MDFKVVFFLCAIFEGFDAVATPLGKPFSILHGFKFAFPGTSNLSSVLYPITNENLFTNINEEKATSDVNYFGPDIQLTYHTDSYDLTKEFFSMWRFEDETRHAAAYLYASENGKETLANLLGISSENMKNKVYVLARYWKILSTTTMTNTSDVRGMTASAVPPNATNDQIAELFSRHGTHYISGYETGDMIYQVFVYDENVGDQIRNIYFTNYNQQAHTFRQFTQLKSQGSNGFCHEVGTIKSISGDSALESIIPQLNDPNYRVPHSILIFLSSREKYELADQLQTTVPIRLFFKSLINKLVPTSTPAKSRWRKVLSAVVFQKFGPASSPDFPTIHDNLDVNIYDSFNPDLVTQTATNFVAITRTTFNLNTFFVSDPQFVTHLFIFADVLTISGSTNLELPGTQKIYLVCREFIALSSGDVVPQIVVGSGEGSEPTIKIVAKTFRGILRVTKVDSGEHFTYDSDTVYKTADDSTIAGQKTVVSDSSRKLTYPDKQKLPELYQNGGEESVEKTWLTNSFLNGVELIVTSAESILTVRASRASISAAGESLKWITDVLTRGEEPSSALSDDLQVILARAQLLTKTQLAEYAKSRLIVPRLTFSQYKPLYDSLLTAVSSYRVQFEIVSNRINERKQTEAITTSLTELNANVKSTGQFLVEQAKVNAEYQDDVANTNQALHNLEKDRISREQVKAEKLLQEIKSIQDDVTAAGKALEKALKDWQDEQIIATVLNVAQVVGSLFTGVVGLGSIDKSLTGIVRVAEKIKNMVTIIEQISKLYDLGRNMRNDIGTINRALENMPSPEISEDSFPTSLEWDDFDTDIISYTSTGGFLPGQVAGEALDFQRVAKRLSARGRRYVTIAGNIASIKYKQIQIEMQRDLANRQSNRLRSLEATLTQNELSEQEAKTTDLFEIGNIIKMKENQVRSQLIQTLSVMDAALQYSYFQQPTLITRFDIMAIHDAAVNQMRSSISALESFSSRPVDLPNPIEYNVPGVSVDDLKSDVGYKVTIPLTSLPFRDYVRVRILKLEVRVDGITVAANDTVYIQAISSGNAFHDRDLGRNRRQYSSTPTEFRYVYNIGTGQTHVPVNPTDEFSSNFIKITPFDDWTFSLPKVTTNQGIQFSSALTTLRIKFFVNVIFHPPTSDQKKHRSSRRSFQNDDVLGSKDALLTQMKDRSLVGAWDAIMAVNADRVNEIWQEQYDSRTNAGFVRTIKTERTLSSENRRRKTETSLRLDVGAPKIQFIRNNQNRATLTIKILSTAIEYWETSKRDGEVDNWSESITTNEHTVITANMNLQRLRGSLTEADKVVLDLSDGTFDVPNLPLPSSDQVSIRHAIQVYFTTQLNSSDYELATITYEKQRTPAGLVPDKFYLATGGFTDTSFGTLYIFIKTHSPGATATHDTPRDFNDPLSIESQIIPTNYRVALFINNRVIFKDILKNEINRHFGFGVHTKVLEGGSISPSQQSVYVQGNSNAVKSISMIIEYDRAKDQRFTIRIPGNTLTAKSKNKGRQIEVDWRSSFTQGVPYSYLGSGMAASVQTRHKNVDFNTRYVAQFDPEVDANHLITYNVQASGAGSSDKGNGWVEFFLDSDVKEARSLITTRINNYMSSLTSFNFQAISAFALTQVLFPNQNVFSFTEVYIPGDMIILEPVESRGNQAKQIKSTSRELKKVISQKATTSLSQKSKKGKWKNSVKSNISYPPSAKNRLHHSKKYLSNTSFKPRSSHSKKILRNSNHEGPFNFLLKGNISQSG